MKKTTNTTQGITTHHEAKKSRFIFCAYKIHLLCVQQTNTNPYLHTPVHQDSPHVRREVLTRAKDGAALQGPEEVQPM